MSKIDKKEKVLIADDDKIIELTGAALEAFEADRLASRLEQEAFRVEQEKQKELKISAYKKLGLSEAEINAIL